ncbi:NAD(P)/FAD-dependent oxidoreductase [Chachezhania antarctica]|uniref:NAD(P)/FAD-dependent oxidoreductase n=1 Tax=Chachezhania antarctica TaxID=2340860 RepID=UPI0013CF3961|nr:FAD-binding oxidoreductase [Chachezhania antarctica]|tara:strand:- start:903 stop:2186 length:1284 start_codon:yes stop_codon:yes gene_type:complete
MPLIDIVRTKASSGLPPSAYAADVGSTDRVGLMSDIRTDVAIVGAGIMGLSTALSLAESGVNVVVLEANEPGWGASGRNGGQVNSGLKHAPQIIERDQGAEAVRFSYDAPNRVNALVQRLGLECDYVNGGGYRAATDAKLQREVDELIAQLERRNIPVQSRSAGDLQAATGTDRYTGGLFDPAAGQLNPMKYSRALAMAAQDAGAAVYSNSPVVKAFQGNGWVLDTPGGKVTAEKVLFATNGYTDGLIPRLRRSLMPVFSTIAASRPLPAAVQARILAGREVLYETGLVTYYYRVDAQGRFLFGGRGPMRPIDGAEAPGHLQALAERLWPELREIGWEYYWNGRVCLTADHYPHVHEFGETGLACVGLNGRGVAMATALGPVLAARLRDGRQAALPLRSSQIKPVPFQPFWPLGVEARLMWNGLVGR